MRRVTEVDLFMLIWSRYLFCVWRRIWFVSYL